MIPGAPTPMGALPELPLARIRLARRLLTRQRGLQARERVGLTRHSSPHNGLPSAVVNPENIRLKLTLTRVSPLVLASTEW